MRPSTRAQHIEVSAGELVDHDQHIEVAPVSSSTRASDARDARRSVEGDGLSNLCV